MKNQLKLKKVSKADKKFIADDIESEELGDELDSMMGFGDVENDDSDSDLEEFQESVDPHQKHLQYLRDIASGKYDKDLM